MIGSEYLHLAALLAAAAVLLYFASQGMRLHTARLRLPVRIHVGGTRGKTSVCRLVDATLRANGVRPITKTTGTEPLVIFPDGSQHPWHRIAPPSIREQRRFIGLAARAGADAMVLECMAVRPDIVWASEHRIVRSTIAVITNIRPDHLEETPSREALMLSFLGLVPTKGVLVVSEEVLSPHLSKQAAEQGTRVIPVRTEDLSPAEANAAIARAVCEVVGAETPFAARSALQDPGEFRVTDVALDGKRFRFANAFACNDIVSLGMLWRAHTRPSDTVVALLNHRSDRPLRSLQFLDYLGSLPSPPPLLLMQGTAWLRRRARRRGLDCQSLSLRRSGSARQRLMVLGDRVPAGALVWGIGNYHGAGADITQAIDEVAACSR